MHFSIFFFIIMFHLKLCLSLKKCEQELTCYSCIQTPNCVWCVKPLNNLSDRCLNQTQNLSMLCQEESIINRTISYKLLENSSSVNSDDAIQIQPQRVKISMGKGDEFIIPIIYQELKDFPIDLYFLLDFSNSMKPFRSHLTNISQALCATMKNISNNFRVGYGTFVDKPVPPYTARIQNTMLPYEPTYSYKHHMSLSSDVDMFEKMLNSTPISGNYDKTEGGFDGLMQAIVCTEQIGWRKRGKRILIYVSDADFHVAGDGKLGGVVEPNDERCHLDEDGKYTHDLLHDYPSVIQISRQAIKNNINIIFAIHANHSTLYNNLSSKISGSTSVRLSRNIIDIVIEKYQENNNIFRMIDDAENFIKIVYYSKCISKYKIERSECFYLTKSSKIEFEAKIKVLQCPKNEYQLNQIIKIGPEGINEYVTVELDIRCQCPCEHEENVEYDSRICHNHGTLKCGTCSCNTGRYGHNCECDENNIVDTIELTKNCRQSNVTSQICSGRGNCECRKCECHSRKNLEESYYGAFCECDNFSCPRYKNLLCSGPEKGTCDCGECKCKAGWSGKACECQETQVTCIQEKTDKVCSGNGHCECGVCNCTMTEKFRYSGQYCEECPDCKADKCDDFRLCVECKIHSSGEYGEFECKFKCSAHKIEEVESVAIDQQDTMHIDKVCRVADISGCTIVFKYKYTDIGVYHIKGQKTKECSKELNIIAIVSTVVGCTLLVGVITLTMWKVLTNIHDHREYIKFEEEIKKSTFANENPLYRKPNKQRVSFFPRHRH